MPVAEILAGIALVKSSVDFIKSNIDTCKDIGEIGSHIDGLFRGKAELDKKVAKRGIGIRDQFDVTHVAQDVIDAKLAAEQLQEISNLVNLRFGPNTWREIVDTRAKMIQEHKAAVLAEKKKKAKENAEMWEQLKTVFTVAGIIFLGLIIIVGAVWYSRL